MNNKLVVVYYNRGKHNLFRAHIDVRLSDLKDQQHHINDHLNHIDESKVDTVEYRHMSIDLDGRTRFTQMKL